MEDDDCKNLDSEKLKTLLTTIPYVSEKDEKGEEKERKNCRE